MVAAAFVLSAFVASGVAVEALVRPLVIGVLVAFALQLALSAALLSSARGSFVGLVVLFLLIGLPALGLILAAWLTIAALVSIKRGSGLGCMPWLRTTQILNAVAGLTLLLVVANAAFAGALRLSSTSWDVPRGEAAPGLPDIYVVMLDGYPRLDTLATDFGFDNLPFLAAMESRGFTVATRAHTNYNATVLTLASMLHGKQIPLLVSDPPDAVPAQLRAVSMLINQGTRLRDLRRLGYEIVSIPSEYDEATIRSADRTFDGGQLSIFEMNLLTTGGTPRLLAGFEREWLPDEHRARVLGTFEALGNLAAERGRGPKFVFAHVLAPHMPVVFTKDGDPADPLPCFPIDCSLFDYGDAYRDALTEPIGQQITWLNSITHETVRTIQARSERPPVIVIFSDHGMRHLETDRDEMFRSLFLAVTPGRAEVFPDDTTPVNLMTRLLNAYANSTLALSSEESYWIPTRGGTETRPLSLERWPVDSE